MAWSEEIEVIKRAGAKGYDPSEPEGQFGNQDLILRELQREKGRTKSRDKILPRAALAGYQNA